MKKNTILIVLMISLLTVLTACNQQDDAEGEVICVKKAGDVNLVASVAGEKFTVDDLIRDYKLHTFMYKKELPENLSQSYFNMTYDEYLKRTRLQELILGKLYEDYYLKKDDLQADDFFDKEYQRYMALADKKPELKKVIEDNNIDERLLKIEFKTALYTQKFRDENAELLKDNFALSKEDLENKRLTVNLSHILLDTKEDAEQVSAKLAAGKKFEELAKQYSIDKKSAENGGNIGQFEFYDLPIELSVIAFNTDLNIPYAPIKTVFGYHIIRVDSCQTLGEKLKNSTFTSDEDIDKLKLELTLREVDGMVFERSADFLQKHAVEINQAAFNKTIENAKNEENK